MIAMICDISLIKQRALSELAGKESPQHWRTESPECPSRPLYLLPDKTSLLKSIRSEWITDG